MSDNSSELILVGAITGARGLKGDVRVKSFTADPKGISDYGDVFEENGQKSYSIKVLGQSKGQVFARLGGIDNRTAAEALKGTRLYVPKSAMPEPEEDEFYFSDLVGLSADLVDGGKLGRVKEVHDFGAGAILEVTGGELGVVMVPFSRATVPIVDVAGGRVVIDPPLGLLEPAPPEAKGEDGGEE
ncbi:MAG: 16S rRNA processing protein RimM [Rhodospirillales bacterium]|nr:16S rRNA processing protein RimM [Rhodospirillales bacterium]